MLKKILAAVLALALGLCLFGCSEKSDVLDSAVDALKEAWAEYYRDSAVENDGYLQLVNTRLITFKENGVPEMKNIAYVVEFTLFTDYHGAAPYYAQTTGILDTATVYKDGSVEIGSNPLRLYSQKYYNWDYSAFIESVEDLGDAYNFGENL